MTLTVKRILAIVCIVAMLLGLAIPAAATTVSRKTQIIVLQPFGTKVYGDAPFKVTVTPDPDSGLTDFIYISSNPDVADISDGGTVTIKTAGETNITVVQLGNDEYSLTLVTQKLVVISQEDSQHFTRGTLCHKLVDILEVDIDSESLENVFTDITVEHENYDAILWMANMGYINGYEDGSFMPETGLTNAELAAMLTRMVFGEFDISDDAVDMEEFDGHWAYKYIWKATNCGLMPHLDSTNVNNPAIIGSIDYSLFKNLMQDKLSEKRTVSITSIDLNNKTAVLDGVLPEDEDKVQLDFNKIMFEINPPEKEFAYVLDAAVNDAVSFGSVASVKFLVLTDNGVETLEIGNNAKVNDTIVYTENNSCSDGEHYACDNTCAYKAISAIPVSEVVEFTKNEAGEVVSITTADYSDSFDGYMYTDPVNAEYDLENGSLNGVGYIDPDTKVFAIDIVAQNSRVFTIDALEDENYYTVLGMYATTKANDNNIIVVDLASLMYVGATLNIAVITEVGYGTNGDGDDILNLAYFENSDFTYADTVNITDLEIISDRYALSPYDISVGDIVKLKLDSNSLVCAIKFVVNFTEDTVRDYTAKNTVVAVDTAGSGNEVFDGGYVTAYNESKSIATLNSGNQYKLSRAVNTYVIDGTKTSLYIYNGSDNNFEYFEKLYGTEPVALYFSDRALAPDIDNIATTEAQKYADHIYVRTYEDSITDVVIIKGALTKVTAASGSSMSAYGSSLAVVSGLADTTDEGEKVYKLDYFIPSEEDDIATDIIAKGSITEISDFSAVNKLTALNEEDGVIEDDQPISGGGSGGSGGSGGGGTSTSIAIAQVTAYNLCLKGEMAANYELLETRIENLSVYKSNLAEVSVAAEGEDGKVTGSGIYLWGSLVTVSAVPDEGNAFEGWYLNGECVSTQNEYAVFVFEDMHLVGRFGIDTTVSTDTVYTEKDGKWLFITSIKNCPENAELVIALCEGGRMIDFKATKDFTNESATVYLDKNSFDKAKVMLWDAFGSLKPLAEVKEVLFK